MPRWFGFLLAFALLAVVATVPDWSAIGAMLAARWPGLIPVAFCRFIPIAIAAEGWRMLFLGRVRRERWFCFSLMWLREAINSLLPSAKIGGEVASVVLLRRHGLSAAAAIAATLAETFVSVIALTLFIMVGLGWLSVDKGGIAPVWIITGGLTLIAIFTFLIQGAPRLRLLGRVIAGARRLVPANGYPGLWPRQAIRIERWLRWYAEHPGLMFVCWLYQLAGWSLGAGELYLAAYVLHIPLTPIEAVMLEAAIQAAANAGFFLPAGLGAQEAALLGAGALIGLPPEAAAALAVARRGRDVLIYSPALLRWSARIASDTNRGLVKSTRG